MAEKNKAERKRINAFDVVIILLLICLVATFGYRTYVGVTDGSNRNVSEYVIEFEAEGCNSVASYIKQGDAVYLAVNGEVLGYIYIGEEDDHGPVYIIADVETEAPEEESESTGDDADAVEDGFIKYKNVIFGGKIRLGNDTVKVKNGNYYTVGGINVTRGSVIEVYTEKAVFTITVKTIDTVNE